MKKPNKAMNIVLGIIAISGIMGASFAYANNIPIDVENVISENNILIDSIDVNTESIDDYYINIYEFEVESSDVKANMTSENIGKIKSDIAASNTTQTENTLGNIEKTNKYGTFSLITENGKIKKYKYGDNDISQKYLVKGSATFTKKEITFDGYFVVNDTLTGNKKGQITMYKGKLDLPNGDKFDGYLSSGKYYSSGTYTWKNGQSYKGKFTTSNKIGTSTLGENETSEYGTFYYDSSKKTYLFIRFVNGVPRKSGYYKTNSNKYRVTFDDKGNCISTSKVSS